MELDIKKLFDVADKNLKVNTAYPIFKDQFLKYKKDDDIFINVTDLSFYIHVPFCKQLCSFCEYTKFLSGNENAEKKYLTLLDKQIKDFQLHHPNINKIYGFDIGGGTPTSLSNENFKKLISIQNDLENRYEKVEDFEKSIEISFSTINDYKLEIIKAGGFDRISAGMQSINKKLLEENNRIYTQIEDIVKIKEKIQNIGIKKLNIDLMYGMANQDDDTILATIKAISIINPEQVTLYETRFNRLNVDCSKITRESQYHQYKQLYNELIKIGYAGTFGKNTFTKANDSGVSSYLKYRMEKCIPYKGFGISAQSMSLNGLSYGIMNNTSETKMPDIKEINEGINYILPKDEIVAKYISIAMYNGSFNLDTLQKILKCDPLKYFKNEFKFIFENKLMYKDGNIMYFTEKGFRYYGAVNALFWSSSQKNKLMEMI